MPFVSFPLKLVSSLLDETATHEYHSPTMIRRENTRVERLCRLGKRELRPLQEKAAVILEGTEADKNYHKPQNDAQFEAPQRTKISQD